MRRPVRPHEARAVDGEDHRQALQTDVVHDLVVGPLEERRVDGDHRALARGRQTGGETYRMRLGYAHIEEALRKRLLEQVEPGARRPSPP